MPVSRSAATLCISAVRQNVVSSATQHPRCVSPLASVIALSKPPFHLAICTLLLTDDITVAIEHQIISKYYCTRVIDKWRS